jgi:hypothetical protein
MKNPIPIGAIIAAVVVALGLVVFVYTRAGASESGPWTSADRKIAEGLEKAGGNPQRLDPETRRLYEERVVNNPMSTRNRYAPGGQVPSSATSAPGPRNR